MNFWQPRCARYAIGEKRVIDEGGEYVGSIDGEALGRVNRRRQSGHPHTLVRQIHVPHVTARRESHGRGLDGWRREQRWPGGV